MVEVARLEHEHPAEHLFGLDERTVGEGLAADRGRRVRRLERQPGHDLPALLSDPRGQVLVGLHDVGRQVGRGHLLEDQHCVLRHHATLSQSKTPATQSPHARSLAAWSTPSANRWCATPTGQSQVSRP